MSTATIIPVSTSADFEAAVAAANASQVATRIIMAPGVYQNLYINYDHFSSTLSIESASQSNPAVIEGMAVRSSSNISFSDIEFAGYNVGAASVNDKMLYISNSNVIQVKRSIFEGNATALANNATGNGVTDVNSTNIQVQGSLFENVRQGVFNYGSTGVRLTHNTFQNIFDDGIDSLQVTNLVIDSNFFTNMHIDPTDTVHPDAIQLWTQNATSDSKNIDIEHNTYVRGSGGVAQGIFVTSQNSFGYQNVTVAHNAIEGAAYNGIWVDHATGVSVTDNVVQPYAGQVSWMVYSNVSGTIANNEVGYQLISQGVNQVTTTGNTTLNPIAIPDVGSFVSLMASINTAGSISPLSSTYTQPLIHPILIAAT